MKNRPPKRANTCLSLADTYNKLMESENNEDNNKIIHLKTVQTGSIKNLFESLASY